MATIIDLGQRVKQKYPGSYDDLPDEEVGKRVKIKFPGSYDEFTDIEPVAQIPQPKTTTEKIAEPISNVLKGAAKEVGGTLFGIGKLAGKASEAIGLGEMVPPILRGEKPEILEPRGRAQKIGAGIAGVAEFAVPFSKVGKLTKGAGLLKRATTEAITGGGITALQRGDIDKQARDAAILSAIFPVGGGILRKARGLLPEGKAVAARVVNSLIKPLQKDLSYGKNPGRAVAEEGITGKTFDELADKIALRKSQIGQQIQSSLSKVVDKKIDLSELSKPIDDAIRNASKAPKTNAGLINRLNDVKDDLTKDRKLSGLIPLEAFEIKQVVADITKFTGNVSDDGTVNKALKQVYGRIKGKIERVVPGIKSLNERYADLTSAGIATVYRDKILERQNLLKFGETTFGIGGALTTALLTGGAAVPSLLAGMGAAFGRRLLGTPIFKTHLAKWLAKATPEQKKELFQKVPWVKGIILEGFNE